MVFCVGLTGGIGCGKSVVANFFAELTTPVIDADLIAREVITTEPTVIPAIVQHFGSELLLTDGTLNRQALRNIIFQQPQQRQWLEKLLHPFIRQRIMQQVKLLNSGYCLVIIPLLLRDKTSYPFVKRILVVDCPQALQVKRVCARDHISGAQAQAIISTQVSRQCRLEQADDLIINTTDLTAVKQQVVQLHQHYVLLAKQQEAKNERN